METKTYFASSIPAALEAARKDLGADAMLVNSRPAPPNARSLGRLEVTFNYDPALLPMAAPAPPVVTQAEFPVVSRSPRGSAGASATAGERFEGDRLGRERPPDRKPTDSSTSPFAALRSLTPGGTRPRPSELDEIRKQLADLQRTLDGSVGQKPPLNVRPGSHAAGPDRSQPTSADPVFTRLCRGGMDPELAAEIVSAGQGSGRDHRMSVAGELARRIPFQPLGAVVPGRIIALVGPPGRGKSLTIAKIAFRYGLAARLPVQIAIAGDHGPGGDSVVARHAALLGIRAQSFPDYHTLDLALHQEPFVGLQLIDTPGLSPAESVELDELGQFFEANDAIERHLVLRTDSRAAEMAHMVARFMNIGPSRLLFTAADEALSLCPLIETLLRTGLPATLVGTGRGISGDLEELDVTRLAKTVCGDGNLAAAAA